MDLMKLNESCVHICVFPATGIVAFIGFIKVFCESP